MDAADWKQLKKIDAHIHIIPDEVHRANPDAEDVWAYADLERYRAVMEENHVEKAVIMPLNDPFLMSMGFTADDVHRNLFDMKQRSQGQVFKNETLFGVRRSFLRVRRVRKRHSPAVKTCAETALHQTPVCLQTVGRMKSRTSMSAGSEYTER